MRPSSDDKVIDSEKVGGEKDEVGLAPPIPWPVLDLNLDAHLPEEACPFRTPFFYSPDPVATYHHSTRLNFCLSLFKKISFQSSI